MKQFLNSPLIIVKQFLNIFHVFNFASVIVEFQQIRRNMERLFIISSVKPFLITKPFGSQLSRILFEIPAQYSLRSKLDSFFPSHCYYNSSFNPMFGCGWRESGEDD